GRDRVLLPRASTGQKAGRRSFDSSGACSNRTNTSRFVMTHKKEFILALEGVNKSFDGFKAIADLNFYMDEGELRVVIGPNGAGKSTMLDLITGRAKPDCGKIEFSKDTDLTA